MKNTMKKFRLVSKYANYLTWDEIRLLKNEGVTIGSHSYSHSHLANFTSNQLSYLFFGVLITF